MANNKLKRPNNFKGVVAVIWTGVGEDIGYETGDVVDFVMDGADVGSKVWGNPKFEVVFIKDKTAGEMAAMTAPLLNMALLHPRIKRRKFKYDFDKMKTKANWDKAEADVNVISKDIVVVNQPAEIVIP